MANITYARHDVYVFNGDALVFVFNLLNEDGDPITPETAEIAVSWGGGTDAWEDDSAGTVVIDGNEITATMPAAETVNLPTTGGVTYQLRITQTGGVPETWIWGIVNVLKSPIEEAGA